MISQEQALIVQNILKKIISDFNPLFQGVQANDSKDLVIFLLEAINNELVKIHNKKRKKNDKNNDKNNENEFYQQIDISDEKMVLDNFLKEFKETHCSVIGDNLCGFQKSIFICQNCSGKAINFNIFNLLIFGLEATSNYCNLNNSMVPTINFDNCFKFLSKEEIFENTYCQHCQQTGKSIYKESIYIMPNYLIIILNRGKGKIFNCNVQIPEEFCPSNYVENEKEKKYNLVGIVSHFGESGMGGHFIAFCKHNIDGKWRCYNDSIVTECKSDYLKKGIPYIVFYQKELENNNSNQINQVANQNNLNIINNQSNNGQILNNFIQMNMLHNNMSGNMNNDFINNNNINYQQIINNNNQINENINNYNFQQCFNMNTNNNNNNCQQNMNIILTIAIY